MKSKFDSVAKPEVVEEVKEVKEPKKKGLKMKSKFDPPKTEKVIIKESEAK
jgi:hypothetical protein